VIVVREYWFAIVLACVVLAWAWHLRHRRRSAVGAGPQTQGEASPSSEPPSALLSRGDVEARLAALREREKPALGFAVAGGVIAIPVILTALLQMERRSAIYVTVIIGSAALLLWQRRHLQLTRDVGLICPLCGAEQSMALPYLGRCPSCQAVLLAPSDRRPIPKSPITDGSVLRNVTGAVVLIVLLAWSLYELARVIRHR